MKVSLYRKSHFNAAHRLHCPDWSDEKNKEVFGKCSNPNFHGHNYNLEVGVKGEVDPTTGFVISVEVLKKIIKEEVEEYLDHKNLNIEIPEFQTLNPTVENIAILIWNRIRKHIPADKELMIKLYETERNFVEYRGE